MIVFGNSRIKVFGTLLLSLSVVALFILGCEKVDLAKANIVTTSQITYISTSNANGGGSIFNGGKTSVSSRGICWSTESMPTINDPKTTDGIGDGNFMSILSELSPATTYHVRAYASNSHGVSYGNEVTFTTLGSDLPILETTTISNISSTAFTSGGNISFEGIGSISLRGVCWSVNNPPTTSNPKTNDGAGMGAFTSEVSGLDPNYSYYVRAYATNDAGTAYGNLLYLKAYQNSVSDVDGNLYQTVAIGTQVWTVENLKVTKYQNGEAIENIKDDALWNHTEAGAYCEYDNNPEGVDTYGRLYNWYAASDIRNIAPQGWHVATYADYQILVAYLGGKWKADEAMKNNAFKALSGGKRNRDGLFQEQGVNPYFWTSTEYHEGSKWARFLVLDGGVLDINNLSKNYGFAVRCVRD